MEKTHLRKSEFARAVGVHDGTLQRWVDRKLIQPDIEIAGLKFFASYQINAAKMLKKPAFGRESNE